MSSSEKPPQKKITPPDNLVNYFKHHLRETITYILLILGIILLFFDPLYGGILVGIIAGIYFSDEVVTYIKSWSSSADSKNLARNLILGGIAIAFFISAPAIFLGAAISVGVKHLFIAPTE